MRRIISQYLIKKVEQRAMNKNICGNLLFFIFLTAHLFVFVDAVCRNGRIIKSGITEEERRLILEEHNYLRQTVAKGNVPGQPAAQNMQEMRWDDELAIRAQMWANVCSFSHDPSRYLDRFIMGQNVGLLWSTAPLADDDGDFPSRVRNWFNEVQKYAWGSKWSVKTGHYSQLVWGDTNLVGCGFTYYQDTSNRLYNKIYVCNYGPGGNVLGAKPYEIGPPRCRRFGMSDSLKYPGLCDQYSSSSYDVNENYEIHFNSFDGQQQENSTPYYNYNVINGRNDNRRVTSTSRRPSSTYARQQQIYNNHNNNNNNNEVQNPINQQQYQTNRNEISPFLQAYQRFQQQHNEKRPIDRTNPFQTYRWNQLFKNYV